MANTISVPAGLGKYYTYMNWNTVTARDSNQYKLREQAFTKGVANYDSDGYARINGRYVVAVTSKFGNVGDYIDIQTANGKTINAVIGDIKRTTDSGANEWGHEGGQVVLEYITNWNSHDNPKSDGGIISITNTGKNFLSGDFMSGTDTTTQTGLFSGLWDKVLTWIITTVIIIFLVVVSVWFFCKAFDIKIGGLI